MKNKKEPSTQAADLRHLAEQRLREQKTEVARPGTEQDTQRLVHELQVHQIELEMQNEELLASRAEVEVGLERYVDLYDFAPVGYFTLDRSGMILQANLTGAVMLGLERSKLVNRRLTALIAEQTRPAFRAFLEKVLAGQAANTCEVVIPREDREPLVVEITATCDGGKDCRVTITDISARKRAEEVLQARTCVSEYAISHSLEEVLAKTLDEAERLTGSQIGFFHFVDADQKTLTLQQWSMNTLRNMCTAEGKGSHYPVDKAGVWVDALHQRRAVIHNDYISLSHRKGLPPGHAPVVRELVVPVLRDGRIVGLVGVGNKPSDYGAQDVDTVQTLADLTWDIVERKQAEATLQNSETKHRDLFNGAADSIFVHDLKGQMLAVNPFACERLGYTHAELMAMTVDHVDSPAEAPHAPERIAHLMERGTLSFETVHQAKDGSLVPTEVNSRRIMWDGQPAMLSMCRDLTERKILEAKLLQAQKMEAIGQLAGGVAHDFRNQLQVIMGFGQILLRRDLVKEDGRAMLDHILRVGERSATTTGRLLAYGRRETLHPVVQSVKACVAEAGKILPHMIGEEIRMIIRSGNEDDQSRFDSHLLQQAITNLATNARDAMPTGGAMIIETACVTLGEESRKIDPELAAGQYVVISVSDTGCGMDEATLAKALEPFFTTKEVGKGTGLGLAMVYGFVKQSGGAIDVQSEPDRGTTVRLYFPRIISGSAEGVVRQDARPLRGGNETVLVVEDEASVLWVAAQLLRDGGYHVLESASAEEAQSLVERHEGAVDLLVSDIVMPGMNGVALAGQLCSRYPGLAVLYISGYPGEELARRGVKDSADILLKPFTAESLLEHVRHALDTRKAAP